MKINKPIVSCFDDVAEYSVVVETSHETKKLWYRVNKNYADFISDKADTALLALILPAMLSGEEIHVSGSVSERLLYNISGPFQNLIRIVIPALKPITIKAEELNSSTQKAKGVATGYTGGIDSTSVIIDHTSDSKPAGFRLTHLLYNNVGGANSRDRDVFMARSSRLNRQASQYNLPLIITDSNLDSFYSKELGWQLTHAIRNTSVAYLFEKSIGRFYYASTYNYSSIKIQPSHDVGFIEPVLMPLLCKESLDIIPSGSESTRPEKTIKYLDHSLGHAKPLVCLKNRKNPDAINCGACKKCKRTLLTIEVAGQLNRYERFFNMDAYRKNRKSYIVSVVMQQNAFDKEIVEFAKQNGFKLLSPSQLRYYRLKDAIKKGFNRVKSKLRI